MIIRASESEHGYSKITAEFPINLANYVHGGSVNNNAILGCLLGTAVGDAIGLPREGLSTRRAARMFGHTLSHGFVLSRGMVSDDTEHSCFVAQSLVLAPLNPEDFQRRLAWHLRFWLLGLPAGVGFATLRSILKLWLGFPPSRSGVYSAGNGPAMRSAIIGVCLGSKPDLMREYVQKSTELTHTDPKAFQGAMAVAIAAYIASSGSDVSGQAYLEGLSHLLNDEIDPEFWELLNAACHSAARGESLASFAKDQSWHKGISGYVLHTVAAVVQTWLRHQNDYTGAIKEIVVCGGDADTTAAILGGIVGARVGKQGIPKSWLKGVIEWPRSTLWMEKLADSLANAMQQKRGIKTPSYAIWALPFRNILFLLIILVHGFRRLLPPY